MKVAALGDSITRGVFVEEQCYVKQLGERTGAEMINAGVPGQTVTQGLNRLQTDVLNHQPDICIVAFGMNDHVCKGPNEAKTELPVYRETLHTIMRRLKEQRIRPILCTLHPIIAGDETSYYYARHPQEWYGDLGVQERIDQYSAVVREVAAAEQVPLADVAAHWQQQLEEGADIRQFLLTVENFGKDDGVHPNAAGYTLYADCIAPLLK